MHDGYILKTFNSKVLVVLHLIFDVWLSGTAQICVHSLFNYIEFQHHSGRHWGHTFRVQWPFQLCIGFYCIAFNTLWLFRFKDNIIQVKNSHSGILSLLYTWLSFLSLARSFSRCLCFIFSMRFLTFPQWLQVGDIAASFSLAYPTGSLDFDLKILFLFQVTAAVTSTVSSIEHCFID